MFGIRAVGISRLTSVAAAVAAYTKSLILSLKGDSAYNKNQNSTILDRSVNDLVVTRGGDAAQTVSSFSPFSSTASYYFDGSGDYMTVADAAALQMGSADFTIEFYWYPTTIAGYQTLLDKGYVAAGGLVLQTGNGDGKIIAYASGTVLVTASTAVTANTWNHIVLVRNSGTVTLYLNGVSVATTGNSTNFNNTALFGIGAAGSGPQGVGGLPITGYLSNVRIVKGTAVYTAAFTPPTAALTAVAGTSLLTCHSGRLFDASPNAAAITVAGNTSASTFGPFSPTALTGSVGGSSVWFSGSSNTRLLVANSNTTDFGTGDFTIECWAYATAAQTGTVRTLFSVQSTARFALSFNSSGSLLFALDGAGTVNTYATAFPVNAWTHIAVARSGTTCRMFINGVQVSSATNSTNVTATGNPVMIGNTSSGSGFIGYISDARIVKGTALYTAAFTPPTSQLTAVSGTTLLTCQGNTLLSDNSSKNATVTAPAVTGGSPGLSSRHPYGSGSGWSAYFDGTGDYVSVPSNAAFDFGTGDFTIECWAYRTAAGSGDRFLVSRGNGANFLLRWNAAGNIQFFLNASVLIHNYTYAFPTNTWVHIAVTRSGTTSKLFINGAEVSSASDSTSAASTVNGVLIGGYSASDFFAGYISNVRIVKGTAIYTAAFTPSTAALTAVSGTSLLTLQDNTFKDNSSNAFTITRAGDTAIRAVGPFGAGNVWSGYFDGAGDYLTVARNAAFFPAENTDFTIEAWVYLTATPGATEANIIGAGEYGIDSDWHLIISSTLVAGIWVSSTRTLYTGSAITLNSWNHIAVSRSGTGANNLKVFVNGVGTSYSVNNTLVGSGSRALTIGADQDGDEMNLTGYISNARVVNGTAVYTSNFVPSTSPLTAVAGTSLLTLQDRTFKDNSSNGFAITRSGDARTVAEGPFAATFPAATAVFPGSIYFDGANDYLTIPSSAAMNVLGGDLTIECWFNPTSFNASNYNYLIMQDDGGSDNQNFQLTCNAGGLAGFTTWNTSARASAFGLTSTRAVKLGAWNHIAVTHVKSTNTTRLFLNGVLEATSTTAMWAGSTQPTCIGNWNNGLGIQNATYSKLNGYLSGVRLIKGEALYTAAFTPPTAPPSVTAGTALLLNFNDGAIVDPIGASSAAVLNTVGNVSTDTVTKKFGTGSLRFDGTGDYITMAGQPEYAFGTGDFTVECWVNPAALGKIIYDSRSGAEGAYIALYLDTDGTIKLSVNTAYRITTRAILANTWTHVALVRSSGTTKIYLDGIQSGSSYTDSTVYLNGASRPIIGASGLTPSTLQWNGYMDDVRVYRGLAKYTTSFLPSESESTVASPSSFSWAMAGAYPGDALTAASTSALALGTGDFTLEAWVYINANTANTILIVSLYDSVSTKSCQITFGNSGFGYKLGVIIGSTSAEQWSCALTQTSILGTWTHIAFTRQSSTCRLFVNGVVQNIGSGANPSTYPSTSFTNTVNMGNQSLSVGSGLNGYITDARVVKGTALYTAGFTPPTATLSAVSGTSLLTAASSTLVDSSSTAAAITTVGTPVVSSTNPFGAGNGWSVSFDGSSYFSVPRDCVQFGTGDFTMEAWINPASTSEMSIFNRTWSGSNFLLCYISGGAISFWVGHALAGSVTLSSAATAIKTNQWQHIALTRKGTAVDIWVDGVSVATGTCAVNLTNADATPLLIGRYIPSGVPFSGYISNVRVVNGTAVYTTSFTPPTAKLSAVSGTAVLTAQNATAIDNSSNALAITAGGNARATTTYYKY